MSKETHAFQAETRQILDLMIHSLYSNKEIFLRELISNASDAADKLRFEALSDDSLFEGNSDLNVSVAIDKEARTITISDNGIGMSREEVIEHIGTIAQSGTKRFAEAMRADTSANTEKGDADTLIGQFGVGFYSSFIVATKVSIITRRAGLTTEHGVHWESAGEGEYDLETTEKSERGTEITLHLREDMDEFLDAWRLRSIIHKYADHIPFPIRMLADNPDAGVDDSEEGKEDKEDEEADSTPAVAEWETVNQASALWSKSASSIDDEEYKKFYQHVSHDYAEPMKWLHKRLEGKYEYTLLLYVPAKAPFDMHYNDAKHGVKLYVRRVFIMEGSEDLLPRYLRFIRGVMDSADAPLNVSREILQKSPGIAAMKKGATSQVLRMLDDIAKKDADIYATFWTEFGTVIKEGIIEDNDNRERISDLLRFSSTHNDDDKQDITLATYCERMPEKQEAIYYITADSYAAAANNPHLELLRKKGLEVLLLHDRVDEWLTSHLTEYKGKKLQSVAKGELDLSEFEDEEDKAQQDEEAKQCAPLIDQLKAILAEKVDDVRVSNRLTLSPVCLVTKADADVSMHMQRILKQAGHETPSSKPVLEINPSHAIIKYLEDVVEDTSVVEQWATMLLDQATLAEGGILDNPASFIQAVNNLLTSKL
ncbi:MAG: molecular chaperone HtpG [Mariprofundales bacterium]